MRSAVEAFEIAKRNSSPAFRQRLDSLLAPGRNVVLSDDDHPPTIIIGGFWPSKIPGGRRAECADCSRWINLSPKSGAMAVQRWPQIPVVCLKCAEKRSEIKAEVR